VVLAVFALVMIVGVAEAWGGELVRAARSDSGRHRSGRRESTRK
jgi:hypothetical protein